MVGRNMAHSCGVYTLEALFARSEPHVWHAFEKLAHMVSTCGPVVITPQKTRVVFQVRVRFLACVPRKSYLVCTFEFRQPRPHPRFRKIETYAPHWHGHQWRVASEEELDAQIQEWIREGYAVGQQRHLLE